MEIVNQFVYLINFSKQNRNAIKIFLLLIVSSFLEMLGLGVLLPLLGLLSQSNNYLEKPFLYILSNFFGHPSFTSLILIILCLLVVLYLIKSFFLIYITWRQSSFCQDLSQNLSNSLYNIYLNQSYEFFIQRNSAVLIRNINDEIRIFTTVTNSLLVFLKECSIIVGILVIMILLTPGATLIMVLFIGLIGYYFLKLTKTKLSVWSELRIKHNTLYLKSLIEAFNSIRDIKIYGKENYFLSTFSKSNNIVYESGKRVLTLRQIPRVLLEFLGVCSFAIFVSFLLLQNYKVEELIPVLGVFVASAFRVLPSITNSIAALQEIRYSQNSINALYKEFSVLGVSEDQISVNEPVSFNKAIEITNLGFKYDGSDITVLENINLTIDKGDMIGFIGESGSGKSTLVDLISGLLKSESGSILIDGININELLFGWKKKIGYVQQSIYLTDESIRNNVAFGLENEVIDDNAIWQALKMSNLDAFVRSLPEKLDTIVGEKGVKFSGGQRQRIGVARALYTDPDIIIFDEATSALDVNTELKIVKEISSLRGIKTIIIITHRESSLKYCDKIYRIENKTITI
jgi:ABC-type multidrug transport system fused ATPase/permease subunit